MSSLPVPLSPVIRTVALELATRSMTRNTSCIGLLTRDDVAHAVAVGELVAQVPVLLQQVKVLQGAVDVLASLLVGKGLLQVIEGAGAHRLHRRLDGGVGRHDHDQGVGTEPAHLAQELQPAHAGHQQIDQRQGVRVAAQRVDGVRAGS